MRRQEIHQRFSTRNSLHRLNGIAVHARTLYRSQQEATPEYNTQGYVPPHETNRTISKTRPHGNFTPSPAPKRHTSNITRARPTGTTILLHYRTPSHDPSNQSVNPRDSWDPRHLSKPVPRTLKPECPSPRHTKMWFQKHLYPIPPNKVPPPSPLPSPSPPHPLLHRSRPLRVAEEEWTQQLPTNH